LAVFVAPTEEIEAMIFDSYSDVDTLTSEEIGVGAAGPIAPVGYREAA
jgi:hypothetical protein